MFDRRLLILYGSETGTARDVAESFWCDARRRSHLQCRLFAADDYPIINLIDESLVLFVTSTTGQGELPSNMRQFWRFIRRRSLVADALASMTFAVVGIGDASYQKFNFAAKKVHRRLAMLGGQILMRCALADEQNAGGIEAELDGWRREFWQLIDARMAIDVDEILPDSQPLEPKYCVEWIDDNRMVRSDDRTTKKYCRVTVAENRRVTADDHFQDTRLISFEIDDDAKLIYSPGDVLMVQPTNLDESLQLAINALNLDQTMLNRRFIIRASDPSIALPPVWLLPSSQPISVHECLRTLIDLQFTPGRSFFRLLASISSDAREREKLEEFATSSDDYDEYCRRPHRTAAETLRDFPNTSRTIRFEYLFDLMPIIRARAFSLASCSSMSSRLQILVSRVEYRSTRMTEPRRGLCSTFLSRCSIGDRVSIAIRDGTFRFRIDDCRPIIMIGPGTGVAPFRSMLNARHRGGNGNGLPRSMLFFGCRYRTKDYYFAEEWSSMVDSVEVITAFSRDDPKRTIYVQHRMIEDTIGSHLWHLIDNCNAILFVAGNARQMPTHIVDALKTIATKHGHVDNVDEYIAQLEKTDRLQFETWS